jgi:hypothetical protein
MKKTGKSGLGHLLKQEKISRKMESVRAVLAAHKESLARKFFPRRHFEKPSY